MDEQEIKAVMPGLEVDDQRALLVARQQDIVCTLNPIEAAYLDYLEENEIGPARKHIITVPADVNGLRLPDRLASNPEALRRLAALIPRDTDAVLEPYIATTAEFSLAQALSMVLRREVPVLGGSADVVERANRKHEVRALAQELGIPIADGEVVVLGGSQDDELVDSEPLKPAIVRHLQPTGRVILRGSRGVAGSAVRTVEATAESIHAALDWAAKRGHDRTYLVEVMMPLTVSPNIQMYIDETGIHCVGASDQLMNGTIMHDGNVYPTHARTINEMMAYADTLSNWLRVRGYTGLVGYDFCEHEDAQTGESKAFLAEINPRTNGSTYPLVLARLLNLDNAGIGGFIYGRIRTAARSFAELADRHGGLLLDRQTCRGAVPYNVGYLPQGNCHMVVFEQSREDALVRWQHTVTALAT
jgi:hypothetical protein